MSKWRNVLLEEIAAPSTNALATGPFGSAISSKHFGTEGVPVIRGSNLSEDVGERLILENLAFVSEDKAKEFKRSIARRGDLIFTSWGTIGQVGLVDELSPYQEYVVSNKQMKLTPDPAKADPLFLYYLFSSPQVSRRIRSHAIGSSVPGFNLGQLRSLSLRLPQLADQRRIAGMLGNLDNKIQLNRRVNETLEAVARAIFKSWFVSFEPVHAKIEGRQPAGMLSRTAALFPGKLVMVGAEPIPDGWRLSPISDLTETILGGTPERGRAEYWTDGTIPWINSGAVNRARIIEGVEYITPRALAESATKTLPARTTVLAITGATLGKVSLLEIEACANQSVVGILGNEAIPSEYIYLAVRDRIHQLTSRRTGAAQQHINKGNVDDLLVLIPPAPVIDAWTRVARPLFDQVRALSFQSRTLAHIRDSLLPKLVSGELRLREATGAD